MAITLPPSTAPGARFRTPLLWGGGLLAAALLGAAVVAQIEGDRGIAPVASTADIEVDGITVNTTGKTGDEARRNGWREATRQAWAKAGGPEMPDGQLEGLVSAVVVQSEQIGPRRYIATLGVIFDRARAGQYIGGGDAAGLRSQPLLTIPVLYSGGAAQVYEMRTPWQAAWAQFHAGASAIDYVRPNGGGGDSLLITAGQVGRRSRAWWRTVLDQFGASDVIMPTARLERQWPGGPIKGTFTARYGPDNQVLESFELTAAAPDKLPAMLNLAVQRMDAIYSQALQAGTLKVNPTLNADRPELSAQAAALLAAAERVSAAQEAVAAAAGPTDATAPSVAATPAVEGGSTYTVQFATPDAKAVDATLGAVRGIGGVRGAATTSLAMGGISVMRVTYAGSLEELARDLRGKGYSVVVGAGALSIRR